MSLEWTSIVQMVMIFWRSSLVRSPISWLISVHSWVIYYRENNACTQITSWRHDVRTRAIDCSLFLPRRFNRSGRFVLTLQYSRTQHIKPIKKTSQTVDPFSKNISRNPIMVLKKPIPSSTKLEMKWLRF